MVTEKIAAHVNDNIRRVMDLGFLTVLVLFDYSKAFDTIDHTIILSILHNMGFQTQFLSGFMVICWIVYNRF